jgi:SRSO17 transposase
VGVLGAGLRSETQRAAFGRYAAGLLSDLERKSIEPIAARSRPDAPDAEHQALLYFVNEAPWRDQPVRRSAALWALWPATVHSPVRCAIIDDTGLLKQGNHSVGVTRQYTGSAGKVTNCQVAVSLTVATEQVAMPVDMTLYLPWEWTVDEGRREKARIPHEVEYQPKWRLALNLLREAHTDGVPLGDVVLADADYGRTRAFRQGIRDLGLHYGVGVHGTQKVIHAGKAKTAQQLARSIATRRYQRIEWREGTRGALSARFAFRRVQVSDLPGVAHSKGPEVWLIIEWRDDETRPSRFYLSTREAGVSRVALIRELKHRWHTERVYEDIKGELGFDHYEGRSWVGWHHHVSVVICCYALLAAERLLAFPPCDKRAGRADTHRRAS